MPSPFPGMDPFLENPEHWGAIHQGLITYSCADLNRMLPPRYAASIGERLVLVEPERGIYPDVFVTRFPSGSRDRPDAAGAVGLADPPLMVHETSTEVREPFITVIVPRQNRRVVATIEVLSPANKTKGSQGRDEYVRKQKQLLAGDSHLIEIDLLRNGEHTVAAPHSTIPRPEGWHGVLCLHRGGGGRDFELWPISMKRRLPRFSVPLADGDADIVLDLQAVFTRCYDELGFARKIEYTEPLSGELSPGEREWLDRTLEAVARPR